MYFLTLEIMFYEDVFPRKLQKRETITTTSMERIAACTLDEMICPARHGYQSLRNVAYVIQESVVSKAFIY